MEQVLQQPTFKFYIPLKKDGLSNDFLSGVASTISIDRDGERMSEQALIDMKNEILLNGVNLFGNHEHSWENTLGVVKNAEVVNNQLRVGIVLDDPSLNDKVKLLQSKLKRGIKLGLSVGGSVTKEKEEYDTVLKQKVKIIDGVKLFEVSVVGIPSNMGSYLSVPEMMAKSMKRLTRSTVHKCPACFTVLKSIKCKMCLWSK